MKTHDLGESHTDFKSGSMKFSISTCLHTQQSASFDELFGDRP